MSPHRLAKLAVALCASAGAAAMLAGPAQALPTGGVVVAQTPGTGAVIAVDGKALTVSQDSQRVVIDWRTFNISSDESVTFNQAAKAIAFNRVTSGQPANIDGALSGGGGVWLFAPGGMVFGANARVNVGSFVASTGALSDNDIDEALTIAALGQSNTISSTPGDGPAKITVAKGAEINAGPNGFVALQSENIQQGGAITGGAVGYVVAKGATAHYVETPGGYILQGDIATSGQADVKFQHTGSTVGGFVTLIAPAAAATQDYAGVINLGGIVEAGDIELPGLPNGLVVRVGDDYAGEGGRLTFDSTAGTLSSAGDVQISAFNARLGRIDGRVVTAAALQKLETRDLIQASGGVNLFAASSGGGRVDIGADVVTTGAVNVAAEQVSIAAGVMVNSDVAGAGGEAGQINILGYRLVDADPTSLLIAGPREGDPTARITVRAGSINEGGVSAGDIRLGDAVGSFVDVGAFGTSDGGGNITLAGAVYGLGGVSVLSSGFIGQTGASRIEVASQIQSQGAISIINADGGDIALTATADVQSDILGQGGAALSLAADRNVLGDAASSLNAGFGASDLTVAAGVGAKGGHVTVGQATGGQVILTAAAGTSGSGDVTALAQVHGDVGVSVSGDGNADLNEVTSGGDVSVAMGGSAHLAADVTAQGAVVVNADAIRIDDVTVRADADGNAEGSQAEGVSLLARHDIIAATGSLLATGSGEGDPTAPVLVRAGQITEGGAFGGSVSLYDVSASSADIGAVDADGQGGAINLTGVIYGLDQVQVQSSSFGTSGHAAISIGDRVVSNGAINIDNADGGDIRLSATGQVQSDLDGDGAGALTLTSDRSVLGDANSRLLGGSLSADVQVVAGRTSGGDLTVGRVQGRSVQLSATGGAAAPGDLSVLGDMNGTDYVSIIQTGGPSTGDGVTVDGQVQSEGWIEIDAARDVTLRPGASLHASQGFGQAAVAIATPGSVTLQDEAAITGGQGVDIEAGGLVSIGSSASVTGGYGQGAPADQAWPNASFDPAQGGVYIQAADLNLQGELASIAGEGRGDVLVRLGGPGVVGGDGAAHPGFDLSSGEVGRISARNLLISSGADLEVRDLSLDSARVSDLWLGAPGESRLDVTGLVASTGTTPVTLRLGFELTGGPQDLTAAVGSLNGFSAVPATITVSGSLGQGGPLGDVSMWSFGDILMGSSAYLDAAADPAFDPTHSTATPPEAGRLFVDAGRLQMAAGTRILQQNTGQNRKFAGLLIGAPTADHPLIVSFGQEASAPTVIDIYGELVGADGVHITGRNAADAPNLLGAGLTALEAYRFNGCSFGRGFACAGDTTPYFPTPIEVVVSQTQSSVESVVNAVESFLDVPTSTDDEDRDALGLPVTGSGNGDLWIGAPVEDPQP